MYQGELRINGVLDNNSPNGINLEPQQDFIITNPAEIFTFENVDGKSIARLVKPLDRDVRYSGVPSFHCNSKKIQSYPLFGLLLRYKSSFKVFPQILF